MSGYDEFWLKLQTKNPKKDIAKVKMLSEDVAQAIEKACQTGGIYTDELLAGLSLGIVASFEVVSPNDRKKMVEELCRLLHDVSKLLEPEKKENTDN
jgi:hypothetical protein